MKAQGEIVGYAYDPIENGGGARLIGVGKAFVGLSDDSNAIFVNPAGLAGATSAEVLGMYYTRFLGAYSYMTGCGILPTNFGTFGFGYVGQGSGGIIDTRDLSDLKEFSYSDSLAIFSYSAPLSLFYRLEDERFNDRIDIGGNLKLFFGGFSGSVNDSNYAINFDLGLKYRFDRDLNFGIVKTNILPPYIFGSKKWTDGSEEILSSPTKIGVAYNFKDYNTVADMDMIIPSIPGYPLLFNLGGEYRMDTHFYLRLGISETVDSSSIVYWGYSFGLGLNYEGFKIDYAFKPYYEIGENTVHYFSISYAFVPPEIK